MFAPWKESYDKPIQNIKKQRHHFANIRFLWSKLWFFQWWYTDVTVGIKGSWTLKNLCFSIVVLKKTLESPLDFKEIKWDSSKGNQPWIFTGRTIAEAPILRPHDVESQLIGKDPNSGKDWRQEKEMTEAETAGWHHRLNEHKFEQAPGDSEGQGSTLTI